MPPGRADLLPTWWATGRCPPGGGDQFLLWQMHTKAPATPQMSFLAFQFCPHAFRGSHVYNLHPSRSIQENVHCIKHGWLHVQLSWFLYLWIMTYETVSFLHQRSPLVFWGTSLVTYSIYNLSQIRLAMAWFRGSGQLQMALWAYLCCNMNAASLFLSLLMTSLG